MNKKILFNTWSGAFFNPGGGEVQLLNTKQALEKIGYHIESYDQWKPQRNIDIFHQFSIQLGTNYVVDEYKALGKKIALSTIVWPNFPLDVFIHEKIRDLLVKADVLFTNSDVESLRLAKGFEIDIAKFHKTRNSITPEFLKAGSADLFRKIYQIKGDFVLSIANVDQRKNTRALVEACKSLGLKLVLIGAVRDIAYFNEFKNSYDGMIHLGALTDIETIKSACCACRVFALPSLCETPGISALEAASQGARIVITREGAAQEYFGEHAIYLNPWDQETIKNALLEGWETPASTVQSDFIRERYTWEQTALEVSAGYRKIDL